MCDVKWIFTSHQKPEHGQLVVKYWESTGNVWAGRHVSNAKHESFDKWMALPDKFSQISPGVKLERTY